MLLKLAFAGVFAALLSSPAPVAEPPRFGPGSAGLGDFYFPNAGNGGYDVAHYSLHLRYEPSTNELAGSAELSATATQNLSQFDLDLRGFEISKLSVDGLPADFTRDGQELVIVPRHRIRAGRTFRVEVEYAGQPEKLVNADGSPSGWIPTDDGAFVASAPVGSPAWYPVNDNPQDKATFAISVNVPAGLTAISNGVLVSRRAQHGRMTWSWRETVPMAPYLATATIGRFDLIESTLSDGTPNYIAVDPRFTDRSVLDRVEEIVEFMSSKFGPYPLDAVGVIVDSAPDVHYALETQTKPLFSSMPSEVVLAHELAHQWFGDSVTPVRWKDVWLNEGFATFAQFLYGAQLGGPTLEQLFQQLMAVPAAFPSWAIPPGDPGSPAVLFDHFAVYLRGAATLEALRERVGDDDFFSILRAWAREHRQGNATTEEFISLAEHESGLDLGHFFEVWLFEPTKPSGW